MNYQVRRECGCIDKVDFKGTHAAWKERETLMKKLPCNKCHAKRIQEKVKAGVPQLTEHCFGANNR